MNNMVLFYLKMDPGYTISTLIHFTTDSLVICHYLFLIIIICLSNVCSNSIMEILVVMQFGNSGNDALCEILVVKQFLLKHLVMHIW